MSQSQRSLLIYSGAYSITPPHNAMSSLTEPCKSEFECYIYSNNYTEVKIIPLEHLPIRKVYCASPTTNVLHKAALGAEVSHLDLSLPQGSYSGHA